MVATRSSTSTRSSKTNPCPICRRTKDADCETRSDGMVFCHRGATHHPPEGIKPGEVHNGYAFLGDTKLGKAMFKPDEGKDKTKTHLRVVPSPSRPLLARLPEGAKVPDLNRVSSDIRNWSSGDNLAPMEAGPGRELQGKVQRRSRRLTGQRGCRLVPIRGSQCWQWLGLIGGSVFVSPPASSPPGCRRRQPGGDQFP